MDYDVHRRRNWHFFKYTGSKRLSQACLIFDIPENASCFRPRIETAAY